MLRLLVLVHAPIIVIASELESTACGIAYAAAESACELATDSYAAGSDGLSYGGSSGYAYWCSDTACNAALAQVLADCSPTSEDNVCSTWVGDFGTYHSQAEARLTWCSTPCIHVFNQQETVCPGDCDECLCDTTGAAACESCPINTCRVWLGDVEWQCNPAVVPNAEGWSQGERDLATNLDVGTAYSDYARSKLLSCPILDFASAEEAYTYAQNIRDNCARSPAPQQFPRSPPLQRTARRFAREGPAGVFA